MDLREVLKVTKIPLPNLLERETLVEVKVRSAGRRRELGGERAELELTGLFVVPFSSSPSPFPSCDFFVLGFLGRRSRLYRP